MEYIILEYKRLIPLKQNLTIKTWHYINLSQLYPSQLLQRDIFKNEWIKMILKLKLNMIEYD